MNTQLDLSIRGLIDPPSPEILATFSIDELVTEIKRAVVGPQTWSTNSAALPTLARQCVVTLPNVIRHEPQLLPGGRHLVFQTRTMTDPGTRTMTDLLECWQVSTGLCVWTFTHTGFRIARATFDVSWKGKATVALILLDRRSCIHLLVLQVNLESGQSRSLVDVPRTPVAMGCSHVHIEKDYIGYTLIYRPNSTWVTLLLNWRTQEYILLDSSRMQRNLAIIPGYIVQSYSGPRPNSVRFYAISSLARFWNPMSEFALGYPWPCLEPGTQPALVVPVPDPIETPIPQKSEHNYPHYPHVYLSITESLIRRDTYLLRVDDADLSVYSGNTRTISTYRISLNASATLTCTLLSTFAQPLNLSSIARTGYGLALDNELPAGTNEVLVVRQHADADDGKMVNISGAQNVHLGRNGALVALYDERALISYYL
ncbi:hypothetical protein B0H19DRAFT_1123246 [Mycena capillaripes]|nr:hypothetical protein B0H19DRAFT_1123246 [Mycena capillaripes]